jgi:hypothetical protein
MSKEERRQLFEAQVKAEDELNAERQRQQEALFQQQQAALALLYQQDPAFAALHNLATDPSLITPEGQAGKDAEKINKIIEVLCKIHGASQAGMYATTSAAFSPLGQSSP